MIKSIGDDIGGTMLIIDDIISKNKKTNKNLLIFPVNCLVCKSPAWTLKTSVIRDVMYNIINDMIKIKETAKNP